MATQKRLTTREKNRVKAAEVKAREMAAKAARLEEVKKVDAVKKIQAAREAEAVKKATAAGKKATKKVNANAAVVEVRADTEPAGTSLF